MNKDVLFAIIYCVVTVGAFFVGKYIFPNIPASVKDKLTDLADWAAKFVVWAREFMKTENGEKKMAAVVEQLKTIAAEAGIDVTEDQLKAIAQTAYEAMKAGEAEAQPAQLLEAATTVPAATVVINTTGTVTTATDHMTYTQEESPDGTVTIYRSRQQIDTMPKEEAAASNVSAAVVEE